MVPSTGHADRCIRLRCGAGLPGAPAAVLQPAARHHQALLHNTVHDVAVAAQAGHRLHRLVPSSPAIPFAGCLLSSASKPDRWTVTCFMDLRLALLDYFGCCGMSPEAHEIFDMWNLIRRRAFRHTERNIADTGLNLLLEICLSFENSEFATQYYQTYLLQLLQEVFAVMTGGLLLFPFQAVCVDCFWPLCHFIAWPLMNVVDAVWQLSFTTDFSSRLTNLCTPVGRPTTDNVLGVRLRHCFSN